MDFTIISKSEGSALIENSGKTYLAIDSGLKNRAFVGVDTSRLQSLPGLLVKDGEIQNWMLDGVTEIEGKTLFYGPEMQGKTLVDIEITPSILEGLSEALYTIKDRNFPVRHISLTSIMYCDDGSFLFFPPRLMEFLNSHRVLQDNMRMVIPWNKPGLGGEAASSFTIAALSYRIVTGNQPFPGESEEDIEKVMTSVNYPSPALSEPRLSDDFLSLVNQSFRGKGTLGLWRELLKKWNSTGLIDQSLTNEEVTERKKLIERGESARIRRTKTLFFLAKYRSALVITGATVILLALFLQGPISKFLEEPVTTGMNQEQVIHLYYDSFRTLDTEAMEDAVTSRAGKSDINEISTVYVTSKVRTSYEGTTGLLNPEEWMASGSEPLSPGTQVWGISDLKIKSLGNDTFEVNYIKWTPAIIDDPDSTVPLMPVNQNIRDIVHLSLLKDVWVIDQIKRIKE